MRFPCTTLLLGGLLTVTAFAGTASCGAFDDAEEWGGYWRSSEPRFGRRYEVPPTLYYGHAPAVERYSGSADREEPLYRRIPPTSTGQYVPPYQPHYYGRGKYYGPSFDPYYAPGRDYYGGRRYGWW
ncbi:MAG TPA: hypothetical protein VGM05_15630 [Planctomycetaceae bacterium]